MEIHKQHYISSAVFLWCNIGVLFIAGFMFARVCQAVLVPLQADVLWWADGLSIPLMESGSTWVCRDTGLHDPVTPSRPIFLILKSDFKEQDTVQEVSYFISYNYSSRHPARHVQTGHATLGKVHVRYIYWTKRWRKLYCIYIQTVWVSVYVE